MYSASKITAIVSRNLISPSLRNGCHGARTIVSSVQTSWLFETPDQKDWHYQSRNQKFLPKDRCQRSNLCRTHLVYNAVRHLCTSNSFHASVKQGAIMPNNDDSGLFIKALDYMGISWKLRYNRFKIRGAAQNMYASCVDGIDVQKFFKACNMSDTLFSWFLVTELHVWMSMLRLRQEGREGKYMIHYLVYCMWHDVEARSKQMGISSVKVKEGMKHMLEQFQASLFAYDEGILSDDRTLAAALWRTFFLRKCNDPKQLASMVEYVRQQIQYLETLDSAQLLQIGRIKWLPFKADIPTDTKAPNKTKTIEEELNIMSEAGQVKT